MNSIFVLLQQDENKGDKVICVRPLVQIHKMWKQVLVWALNAFLIVAVGVAWVLVGDRQGRHMADRREWRRGAKCNNSYQAQSSDSKCSPVLLDSRAKASSLHSQLKLKI